MLFLRGMFTVQGRGEGWISRGGLLMEYSPTHDSDSTSFVYFANFVSRPIDCWVVQLFAVSQLSSAT